MRKSKEVDLAGLQAALKKLQSRNNYLENSLEQKVSQFKLLFSFLYYTGNIENCLKQGLHCDLILEGLVVGTETKIPKNCLIFFNTIVAFSKKT